MQKRSERSSSRKSSRDSNARQKGGPKRLGTVVSQLMSRRGYAAVATQHAMTGSIEACVGGFLADSFRVGRLNRGTLEIHVLDSVTMQEFTFQKRTLLKRLAKDHPQSKITDIRFRIQANLQ